MAEAQFEFGVLRHLMRPDDTSDSITWELKEMDADDDLDRLVGVLYAPPPTGGTG